MSYQITEYDKGLILQNLLQIRLKIDVYDDDDNLINSIISGIVSGNSTIDAESDIRRTFNITVVPLAQNALEIASDGIIWLNRRVKLYIGIQDNRTGEFQWWAQGVYVFMNSSATYDSTTNELTLSCSDMMSFLDGSRNGTLGQQIISYPAYEEDETTGEVIKYNYIRDAMITTISQLGYVQKYSYNVDDIGEAKGMPGYLKDWDYMKYRQQSMVPVQDGTFMETWNAIPYDLEFSSGTTILEIVTTLRDLYENYETYFDENGVFCCKMIPSGDDDPVVFSNDYLKKIWISEDLSYDFTEVHNVCESWGEVIETDFYTDSSVNYADKTYYVTLSAYEEKYYNGDTIAFEVPTTNLIYSNININNIGNLPIYDENTETYLEAGTLEAGQIYAFKVRSKYISDTNKTEMRIYLLGQWQPHGMDVATDGTVGDDYTTTSGTTVKYWSKEFFQDVYNCRSVNLTVLPESPFVVQKLGVILQVINDDNISSDSLAIENAKQNNWRKCRLTDSIQITTLICPFADVNIKVTYQPISDSEAHEYLVKSVSHDWLNGTTSWTLMRYYRLYEPTEEDLLGIHSNIAKYTHNFLGNHTHTDIKESGE